MKIDRSRPVSAARAIGGVGYTRKAEPVSAVPMLEPVATGASVLGIPESEFTPRVRDAIMSLMAEVESLRRELQETRSRLEDVEKSADQDHLSPSAQPPHFRA